MVSSRAPIIAAVALLSGSFSMGCSGPDDGLDSSFEMPTLTALTGGNGGTGGDNGLTTSIFHQYKGALINAMGFRLVDPIDVDLVNDDVLQTGLLDTADGRLMFDYAVRCALSRDWEIRILSPEMRFSGGGILTVKEDWLDGPLTHSQKEDVFTCLVAHLNPQGAHIPIWLTGPNVMETETTPASYDVEEALWLAKIDGRDLYFQVWPLPDVESICPSVDSDLGTRTCDGVQNCGLEVRHDVGTACTGAGDVWQCDGGNAIKTRLQTVYLDSLYTECCPTGMVCP